MGVGILAKRVVLELGSSTNFVYSLKHATITACFPIYSTLFVPELSAEFIGRDARFLMKCGGKTALPLIPNQSGNLADLFLVGGQQLFCPVDPTGQYKRINCGAVKHTEQISQF